ncbi:DNA-3-methyladenine glycosylase [Alkalibaculum sp. M08DMB]|uniref:Putative 3-methyladenine DNA glycosylase n=1 Tax=Alkalibaculum sporogenes TaxID=2655001 RepID=A0A6A7K8P1_9FIRM|nr:DNA-3-methyladenine glycosylase [Alkalibaculum sporogenes]MPW25681.1 DNA-3-methyladenine glycosylase [Alkalibaculum sporogenes]
MKLPKSFYTRDTLTVAQELLGKVLVYKNFKVRISETEAYIGAIDKAAHCYGNKKTKRTETMFKEGGYAYVYMIYGMYYCINIVTGLLGEGSAILIRSAAPLSNADEMFVNRYNISREIANKYQIKNLTNGPGKLCKALNITKNENGLSLTSENMYLEDDGFNVNQIHKGKRINIDYAEEAKDFEWRFFI